MQCGCGSVVEDIRVEFGFQICSRCAHEIDAPPPRGVMIYEHKTGGQLQVMSAESWEANKKYYVPNGARSAVKNFSKSICS